MRLISMVDYVLEQHEQCVSSTNSTYKYANFLKQPLELWMFVPCDEDGNVLTKSTMSENTCEDDCNHKNCVLEMNECIKYQQAKERCLFEGFQISTRKFDKSDYRLIENKDTYIYFLCNIQNKWIKVNDYKSVECLVLYNLQLTQTAIKQIS